MDKLRSIESGSQESKELRERLKALVAAEMEQRLASQATDLAQIEKRLVDAKTKLAQRTSKRDEIVERRFKELLQEPDELNWSNSIATSNVPAMEVFPDVKPKAVSAKTGAALTIEQQKAASESYPEFSVNSEVNQIADVLNESLELEATLDEVLANLTEEGKRMKAVEMSLPKRVRLLELKLEALEPLCESARIRFGAELELASKLLNFEKREESISRNLFEKGGEDMMVHEQKKKLSMVAEARLLRVKTEQSAFEEKVKGLSKRVPKLRKRLSELLGSPSANPPSVEGVKEGSRQ